MLSSKNQQLTDKMRPTRAQKNKGTPKDFIFKNRVPWFPGGCFLKPVERGWLTVPCF